MVIKIKNYFVLLTALIMSSIHLHAMEIELVELVEDEAKELVVESTVEDVYIEQTQTRSTPLTQSYFDQYRPGHDFALHTSDQIDVSRRSRVDVGDLFSSRRGEAPLIEGSPQTGQRGEAASSVSGQSHSSVLERNTSAHLDNQHSRPGSSRSVLSGPVAERQLARTVDEYRYNPQNFQDACKHFMHFPELQKNIQNMYEQFLTEVAQAIHPDATREQIEACIIKMHRLEGLKEFTENLQRSIQPEGSYMHPTQVGQEDARLQLSLAQRMFYRQDGLFRGIPEQMQEQLFAPITELQNKLAKIAYNSDGSPKDVITQADRAEWAHLVTEFAEKYVCQDRASFERFLSTCRDNGVAAFSSIADAKVGRAIESESRPHGRLRTAFHASKYKVNNRYLRDEKVTKETIKAHRFNKDYRACADAIDAGDFETAKSIVERYAVAPATAKAREYSSRLNTLYMASGGKAYEAARAAELQFNQANQDDSLLPPFTIEQTTDFVQTYADPFTHENYAQLPLIKDSPFRQELIETFKLIGDICLETKDQLGFLFQRHYDRSFLKKITDMFSSDSSAGGDGLVVEQNAQPQSVSYDLAERTARFGAAVRHLTQNILTPSPEFNEKLRGLLREGRFDEAELEVLDATVGKVLRYAAENLTNLPTFSLQALQGVLQAGRFVKDVALELQLDQVRTPEEYNQALAERFKKWDAAVQAAQNMSPEQIKDMACRFAADILTLEGLARAAEYARSSAVGSHGNAPVDGQVVKPVQKALTVEAEGRSATSQTTPRKEGAPTVRTERSRPVSSVPVVTEETVATVTGDKIVGQTAEVVPLDLSNGKKYINLLAENSEPGSVWERINPTQDRWNDYTYIPKSFEIEVGGQKFWVSPNGSKHLMEMTSPAQELRNVFDPLRSPWDIPAKEFKAAHEMILEDFSNALREATKNGIPYKQQLIVNNWQLEIGYPRISNGYPTVFHARYIGS